MVRLLLLLALFPTLCPAASLPIVSWTRCERELTLGIDPGKGQHLASDLPIRWSVTDGHITVREPGEPAPARGRWLRKVPLAARDRATSWDLRVEGAVCEDQDGTCLPFHAEGIVTRPGAHRGRPTVEAGLAVEPDGPSGVGEASPPPPLPTGPPTNLDAALQIAKSQGLPVLADFSAHWCPPCQHLRVEVLENPVWQPALAGFVPVVLDADDPSSFPAKDRYRIGGYPTVLLLDGDGAVLDRIEGYSGPESFIERLRSVRSGELEADLRNASEGGDVAALLRLARRWIGRGDGRAAWDLLLPNAPEVGAAAADEDLLRALVDAGALLAQDDAGGPIRFPEFALALARRTAPPGAAAAHADQAARALDAVGRKEEAAAVRSDFRERLRPALEGVARGIEGSADAPRAMVQLAAPEVMDDRASACWHAAIWSKEDATAAQDAYLRAAFHLGAALITEAPSGAFVRPTGLPPPATWVTLPDDLLSPAVRSRLLLREGRVHDLLDALGEAGLHDAERRILAWMVEGVPDRFAWLHRSAAFFRGRGELDSALLVARQAVDRGFGDNRLRASQRCAEILLDLGRKAEALSVIDDALAAPEPPEVAVRTHRYRGALTALRTRVSAAPDPAPSP